MGIKFQDREGVLLQPMQVLAESHLAFLIGNDDDEPDQTAPKATASVDNIRIVKQVE